MEKTEIKALIDKAIKGQGTNVDAGGALATILEAVLDMHSIVTVRDLTSYSSDPLDTVLADMEITKEEFLTLFDETGAVSIRYVASPQSSISLQRTFLRRGTSYEATFGGADPGELCGMQFAITYKPSTDKVTSALYEV